MPHILLSQLARTRCSVSLCTLASLIAGCGGGGGGGIVQALICGDGHSKESLSLGLPATGLLAVQDDTELQSNLNSWLQSAGVPQSLFKVESLAQGENTPELRFLKLGGSFASVATYGLGAATDFLKQALGTGLSLDLQQRGDRRGLALLQESGAFSTIQESFPVSVTARIPHPLVEGVSSLTQGRSLFLNAAYTPHSEQWAFKQTDYSAAWASLVPDDLIQDLQDPIRVAVLDTGVDLDHKDLKDILEAGKSFVDGESTADDGNGHGTHCAGIIAGSGGMTGVAAPLRKHGKIKIIPIKVLGAKGSGSNQGVQQGVLWAIKQGVDVISMSLGGGRSYEQIKDEEKTNGDLIDPAIQKAIDAGIIVVVAAGNENCPLGGDCKGTTLGFLPNTLKEYVVHPCSYKDTICVGATDPNETLAKYSNYKSNGNANNYRIKADVNAPGTNIYSTWNDGGYKTISGTSMATPFIAGVAALLKARDRNIDQKKALQILSGSMVNPADVVQKSGIGRVDLVAVARTMESERGQTPTQPAPTPKPVDPPQSGDDGGTAFNLWSLLCSK